MDMKKRCMIICFMMILLCSPFIAEAKEEVFSGSVRSGESMEVDDFTLIITMNKYGNAIFADGGDRFQSIYFGKCEKMYPFEICFWNTTFDEDENDLLADITIYRSKADLTILRTASPKSFNVGEESIVTIEIENVGDHSEKVLMTDDYPSAIEISDLEGGCSVHENQVYWEGHLDANRTKTCSFTIKANKEVHQKLVAYLKYWDGSKWVEEYSSTMTLDIEPVFGIEYAFVREDMIIEERDFDFEERNKPDNRPKIVIGESFRLLVNISNLFDERMDVDYFEIILPPKVRYTGTKSLRFKYYNGSENVSDAWNSASIKRVGPSKLRWDGSIGEGKHKLFILEFVGESSGDKTFLFNTKYKIDDMLVEDSDETGIEVVDPGVGVRVTVLDRDARFSAPSRYFDDDEDIELQALHPYNLKVYLQNINKYGKIDDVKVSILSGIGIFDNMTYDSIEEEGQVIPYSVVLVPPQILGKEGKKFDVRVDYINKYGESHTNITEFDLDIANKMDLNIDLDSTAGTTLEGGEETEITVTLQNEMIVDARGVTVTDILPDWLEVEGIHGKTLKLNKDSETEVYKYKFTAPVVKNKTEFNITTRVTFYYPDIEQELVYEETKDFTIEPFKPSLGADVTLDVEEDILPGMIIPIEYVLENNEDKEVIRDIVIHFPVMEHADLIGPETFLINKLDPGEEMTVKGVVKVRPKDYRSRFTVDAAIIEFKDDYGNTFYEKSSTDNQDMTDAIINGPAIFAKTSVPEILNISEEGIVTVEVQNKGTVASDVQVFQGDHSWNISLAPGAIRRIDYSVVYDEIGNYTIDDPVMKYKVQDMDVITRGTGSVLPVSLILPPPPVVEEVVIEEPEIPDVEKEQISFEEYELSQRAKRIRTIVIYSFFGLVVIGSLVFIVLYRSYKKKQRPAHPFLD